jgi:hypothetical protein
MSETYPRAKPLVYRQATPRVQQNHIPYGAYDSPLPFHIHMANPPGPTTSSFFFFFFFFFWISNNNLLFLILCFSQILCLKDYSLPLFIAFSLTQLNYFFSQPLSFNPFTPSRSLPWLNNPHDLYRVQMSTPIVWPGRRSVDGERLGKWEGFFFFFFFFFHFFVDGDRRDEIWCFCNICFFCS